MVTLNQTTIMKYVQQNNEIRPRQVNDAISYRPEKTFHVSLIGKQILGDKSNSIQLDA